MLLGGLLISVCAAPSGSVPHKRNHGQPDNHANQAKSLEAQSPRKAVPIAKGSVAPVRLELKFRVGDVNRYRMAAEVEARLPATGAQPDVPVYTVNLDLVEEEKVVKALPDGGGELAISALSGQGTVNGSPFTPGANTKPALITFDSHGDLVAARDLPEDNANVPVLSNMFRSGALSMHGVFLPAKPVSPGDTWTKKVTIGGVTGNSAATVKAKFVKEEEVGRYKTAKIHAVMTAPIHALIDAAFQPTMQPQSAASTLNGALTITYDTNLAIAEGKVVRTAGNGQVVVKIEPRNAAQRPGPPSKKAPPQKARPAKAPPSKAHPGAFSPPAPAPHMVMKLHLGTDLIE